MPSQEKGSQLWWFTIVFRLIYLRKECFMIYWLALIKIIIMTSTLRDYLTSSHLSRFCQMYKIYEAIGNTFTQSNMIFYYKMAQGYWVWRIKAVTSKQRSQVLGVLFTNYVFFWFYKKFSHLSRSQVCGHITWYVSHVIWGYHLKALEQ